MSQSIMAVQDSSHRKCPLKHVRDSIEELRPRAQDFKSSLKTHKVVGGEPSKLLKLQATRSNSIDIKGNPHDERRICLLTLSAT